MQILRYGNAEFRAHLVSTSATTRDGSRWGTLHVHTAHGMQSADVRTRIHKIEGKKTHFREQNERSICVCNVHAIVSTVVGHFGTHRGGDGDGEEDFVVDDNVLLIC